MRRNFRLLASMATTALLASTIVAFVLATTADPLTAQAQAKPNIVFVLTDDQFPGTENKMPRLKSNITSKGVKFTNTVSTFPLCCPGRATIQRGQYAHNTGITGNSLPRGGWGKFKRRGLHRSTVATWLKGAGYQTGLFGKYLNNYRDRAKPPGWDRWYAWSGPKMGWTRVNDQGNQRPLERQEADSLVSKKALEFLNSRLNKDAPVFAFVNFGAMHAPFHHSSIDANKFRGARVPRTPAFNEANVSDKPKSIRNLRRLSRQNVSQLDRSYRNGLRSLMRVDRFIGEASALLQRKGELENTYFVFYTDNGAHFGQHRLKHGKLQPYEEDVNFPLIVRGPGVPRNEVRPQLVGNHDIAPTLADIAGAGVPAFVDGRSLLPLLRYTNSPWPRTAILSERETDGAPPNKWDMLRMSDRVYTRHQGGEKEYYDLATDPYQLRSDPRSLSPATRAYYERRLDALYRCKGASCRRAEDAPLLP